LHFKGYPTGCKMGTTVEIPLADLIQALRRELRTAVEEGEGGDLVFALGPIDLELRLEVGREAGGEAGIRFWVVSIGGKGSRSDSSAHTVRLSLTPVSRSGDVLVAQQLDTRPR